MRQRVFTSLFVSLASLLALVGTVAAEPGLMSIPGIGGGSELRAGAIDVLGFAHELTTANDIATGQAASRVRNGALRVTKPVDAASSQLRALLSSGRLDGVSNGALHVTITLFNEKGEAVDVTLTGARLISMKTVLQNTESSA